LALLDQTVTSFWVFRDSSIIAGIWD